MFKFIYLILLSGLICNLGFSYEMEPPKDYPTKEVLQEKTSETMHTVQINGQEVRYKAIAGNLILKNENQVPKGSIFYVAYIKEDVKDEKRPIVFCFNGGPISSAVWLHMGAFGPKRVVLNELGDSNPPYSYIDNEYSLLDKADLVFIDPIGTGYSRTPNFEENKQFHTVETDISAVGDFISYFITRYERWDSPKLLAGESYGTTRAAGLADYLQRNKHIYLNGTILISTVLNFQTLHDCEKGNDLPFILNLPTLAASAAYHKKITPNKDLQEFLKDVQDFAIGDYTLALMQGDGLAEDKKSLIIDKLVSYTGLSKNFVEQSNIRINPSRFVAELLKNEGQCIGFFDTRVQGDKWDKESAFYTYDPSLDKNIGAFTATFNEYLRKELKVRSDQEYKILTRPDSEWYTKINNQFLNMATPLRQTMVKNEALKVFVACGLYDLSTPYFAASYTFNHLHLPKNLQPNVTMHVYDAGHMMYTSIPELKKLKEDLNSWFDKL